MTYDQGQHLFAVILSEPEGEERFRTTVLACDQEQAVQKAAHLAERLNVEVELVASTENISPAAIALLADETDAVQVRESASEE